MRKERKESTSTSIRRTTIFMTEALEFWLDLYCLKVRKPKGEVVREAIENYLKGQGLGPFDAIPKEISLKIVPR